MTTSVLDTVVVGAGQAGLGTSYFLQRDRRNHVVFERGRIGETWLSQRWDSFQINTPNALSTLPGFPYDGAEPDGFWRHDELVAYFHRYVERSRLPVQTGVTVVSIERDDGTGRFVVNTRAAGKAPESMSCRSVVIASGMQQAPKIPPARSRVPGNITQMHASAYRNAAALPPGAVVVAGSAQSGVQIAEDLLAAGRKVYLCTGKVGRLPRRYRGRDSSAWNVEMKIWDVTFASLKDKSVSRATLSQISGVGRYGHTVSLQSLARQGAVVLGRLLDVEGSSLVLSDEAAAHVRFADEFSQKRKAEIDAYLARAGIALPPLENDPADEPDPRAECASPLTRLDLHAAQVATIIWATGFTADFSWIRLPVVDGEGMPIHERGVSPVPGLYFIGFPWLNSRKSGLIYGITEDAERIVNAIAEQLAHRK
jgi:putative flavoprotein involved in K+ transport